MELKCLWLRPVLLHVLTFNRTKWNWNKPVVSTPTLATTLLIVLNGIEMWYYGVRCCVIDLLIVLNGIEIDYRLNYLLGSHPFNRTKWNWNCVRQRSTLFSETFNRTKWNWNAWRRHSCLSGRCLLIVLNGIEIAAVTAWKAMQSLLIVLNGIEIWVCRNQPVRRPVFYSY